MLLTIARSSREDIDLEEVIGTHDKGTAIHLLENIRQTVVNTTQEGTALNINADDEVNIVTDPMATREERQERQIPKHIECQVDRIRSPILY